MGFKLTGLTDTWVADELQRAGALGDKDAVQELYKKYGNGASLEDFLNKYNWTLNSDGTIRYNSGKATAEKEVEEETKKSWADTTSELSLSRLQEHFYKYLLTAGYSETKARWMAHNLDEDDVVSASRPTDLNSASQRIDIGDGWNTIPYQTLSTLSNKYEDEYSKYREVSKEAAGQTQVTDTAGSTVVSENSGPTALTDQSDYASRETAVNAQNAIAQGAQEAQTNAENQARASASAGINKARAGMLGESNSQQSQTNNVANNYAANQSQSASTQADYLQKMAQADALDQQAKNMNKGAALTAVGAGISGAATGMSAGALVSDENCKESYPKEDELKNAIKQFRELYKRLQNLKGGK